MRLCEIQSITLDKLVQTVLLCGALLVFSSSKEFLFFWQEVEDLSDGCGAKISCLVVSDQFEGKPLLQRHR